MCFWKQVERQVATETIGMYQIEYGGQRAGSAGCWAAYLAIYGPSRNPMHRNDILPHQRVAVDQVFASIQEAEGRARVAGLAMLGKPARRHG